MYIPAKRAQKSEPHPYLFTSPPGPDTGSPVGDRGVAHGRFLPVFYPLWEDNSSLQTFATGMLIRTDVYTVSLGLQPSFTPTFTGRVLPSSTAAVTYQLTYLEDEGRRRLTDDDDTTVDYVCTSEDTYLLVSAPSSPESILLTGSHLLFIFLSVIGYL